MPPAQPAATRGQRRAPCLLLQFLLAILLSCLGQTYGAIHIPPGYTIPSLPQLPVISYQTESYTAFYLDDIYLVCDAKGMPSPRYRWVKDDKMLKHSTGTLTADSDSELKFHQGKYRCYASNELGTAESNVIELITEPPPILSKEKRVHLPVIEGESVVLHCNPPKSSVTPQIHWMDKKLHHIQQSERITIGLDANLYFANTLTNDTRNDYSCNAQYMPARTILPKEPISLTVTSSNSVVRNKPPQLYRPLGSHTQYQALKGHNLILECIPHGLPTPTVSWERKDGPLSPSHTSLLSYNRQLVIREISESDEGEYACIANNTEGSITHTYTVTVEAAPYWTKVTQSQLYAQGEAVRLDCQADGIPTPNVMWKINGMPISATDPEPRRNLTGHTLILKDVLYIDTAVYQCEASNKHGTILVNIHVHVIKLPPQILTDPDHVYRLTEGMSALLDCVTFGSPQPRVSWESETSEPALSNPKMSQLTNGTLQIINVSREDTGAYWCSVGNTNLSIAAHLEVMNRTEITKPPQDLQVTRGETGILHCEFHVDFQLLDPTIQWRKDNQKIIPLSQDDKYTVCGNGSLIISSVTSSDTGRYTCEIITEIDMDKATGLFTVVDKPEAPHLLQLSEKKVHSVTLSWVAGDDNSSPVFEYVIEMKEDLHSEPGHWREQERVPGEIRLVEIPLHPYLTYHFRVAAVNKIGMSDFSLPSEPYTTPAAKPDLNPGNVKSDSTNPDSMIITWTEIDRRHFNGPGFKYKVLWREASSTDSNWHHTFVSHPPFTVNQTATFAAFEIKVQAENDVGVASSPVPSIGYSGEDKPLLAPTGVSVSQINNTSISVKWTAVSRESVRGHLKGYNLYLRRLGSTGSRDHHGRGKRGLAAVHEMERVTERKEKEEGLLVAVVYGDQKEEAILSDLEFYSDYKLSITAFNSKGEGPHSEPFHFSTPEGAPGPPSFLRMESPSETELTLFWNHPLKTNGLLKGYVLEYQEYIENSPRTLQTVNIEPEVTRFSVGNLNSMAYYVFYLRASTRTAEGDAVKITGATLLDGVPPKSVNITVGETYFNLSWVPGDRHRNIGFAIHYKRMKDEDQWEESVQVNSTQGFYQLQGLKPGTEYRLEIRDHDNGTHWKQEIMTKLLEVQSGFATQGWFIGLVSALVLLLIIFIILCLIKKSKGGKYSVKGKEEGHVDSEARPMKDETFGEYSDNEEKRSVSQGSLQSKRASDDSLAEYGDSVDIQFNEDGSFIGQYSGRKDAHGHGDHDSSGTTSPNMPPPSISFPNSVTGILGGN